MPCTILQVPPFITSSDRDYPLGQFDAVQGQSYRVTVSFFCDCYDQSGAPGFYYSFSADAASGSISAGVVSGRDWQGGGGIGVLTATATGPCNLSIYIGKADLDGSAKIEYLTTVVETIADASLQSFGSSGATVLSANHSWDFAQFQIPEGNVRFTALFDIRPATGTFFTPGLAYEFSVAVPDGPDPSIGSLSTGANWQKAVLDGVINFQASTWTNAYLNGLSQAGFSGQAQIRNLMLVVSGFNGP
jgi:hypothetical protein